MTGNKKFCAGIWGKKFGGNVLAALNMTLIVALIVVLMPGFVLMPGGQVWASNTAGSETNSDINSEINADTNMNSGIFVPDKRWRPDDLREEALERFAAAFVVRPSVDKDYNVIAGQYDVVLRADEEANADAARAYVHGAALQEYGLPCVSRGSVFSNRQAGKMVALTFDDGPFVSKTPKILKILDEYDARATFFVLGRYVQRHPELAQQILDAGCEVGSHSWFHDKQTALDSEQRAEDFAMTAEAFAEATGAVPYLFRAPYGAVNDEVKADIAGQKMLSVLWSLDTEDWRAKSADQVYNAVMDNVKNGDIILMHENAAYTVEVLPRVLAALRDEGYIVVTVSELIYSGSDIQALAQQGK